MNILIILNYLPLLEAGRKCVGELKDLAGHKLVQLDYSLTGGSTYQVTGLEGFERDIWLCPVTLFVLGRYPRYIYVKKS